ncbi:MAG TPA: WD40 repeat domain-containing protein [Longimicrobium sp.]|nr:WD40 repeat domain-containing protein [Longimicrobium sp.]
MSPAAAPPLPIDAFLDRLASEGYAVGVRERLLVHAFLQRLIAGGNLPDTLGEQLLLLAPLLSRNEREQRRFGAIAAEFAGGAHGAEGPRPPRPGRRGGRSPARRLRGNPRARWAALAGALLLLAALLAWWLWLSPRRSPPPPLPAPPDTTARGVVPDSGVVRPIYVPLGTFPDSEVAAPAEAAAPAEPFGSGAVRVGLSVVGVALLLLAAAWAVQRMRLAPYLQALRTDEELEERVLYDPEPVRFAVPEARVRPVSRVLRQRVAGAREELDLSATLRATVRAGGALAVRWRLMRTTPEYLVLVDRRSPNDHQAAFHERLVRALHEHGVGIDLFHFSGSPARGCWRAHPDGRPPERSTRASFAQLSNRYGGHRLLVFGDPAAASEALTGAPAEWVRHVTAFSSRAWFSPFPLASWGAAEAGAEAAGFLVLPSETAALDTLADWLASERAALAADPDWPGEFPPTLRGGAEAWVARQAPPPQADAVDLLVELREYLGPVRFQWLCACAVFPALTWPLTLALGHEVVGVGGRAEPEALARGVAALGALPWFRHGRMPSWLRELFLDRLDPELEGRVRELVKRRLAGALAGEGGERLAEVAVRRWLLAYFSRPTGLARDVVLAGFLEKGVVNRLAQWIPEPLRRLLFNRGMPLLGVKEDLLAVAGGVAGMLASLTVMMLLIVLYERALLPEYPFVEPYAVLAGHTRPASSAAFSPDGQWIVTASDDNTARIWRADGTGEPTVLRGHTAAVLSAAFSPDGQRVVTASADSTARVWRIDSVGGVRVAAVLRGHRNAVTSASFSPDGEQILTSSLDSTAHVWDADGGGMLAISSYSEPLNGALFTPDERRFIAYSTQRGIWVEPLDGASGDTILWATGPVTGAAFDANGSKLLISWTGSVEVQRFLGGTRSFLDEKLLTLPAGGVFAARLSPGGERIVTAGVSGTSLVWRTADSAVAVGLLGSGQAVYDARFSPDGRRIVTAAADGNVRVFGRRPGILVAIASCQPSPRDDPVVRALADSLARWADARDDALSVVAYGSSAWNPARLGTPPDPGEVRVGHRTNAELEEEVTVLRIIMNLNASAARAGLMRWRLTDDIAQHAIVAVGACGVSRRLPEAPPR